MQSDKEQVKYFNRESGQVLIVVLLIMAVALTVGIAVVSRSIAGLKLSTQEEESARAFSVAEAGLEGAFLEDISEVGTVPVGAYLAEVTELDECKGEDTFYNFQGREYAAGDTATLWLVGHNAADEPDFGVTPFARTNQITICWGRASEETFAVEVGLIFRRSGDYLTGRMALDADSARANENNFRPVGTPPSVCVNAGFRSGFSLANFGDLGATNAGDQPYVLRIRPVYNLTEQPLAVASTANFPAQGEGYEATATVGEGPGSTVRVQQCQTFKAPPDIFDYALFSDTNISH